MKCYYHNDADGRCSGAIVYSEMENYDDNGTGFTYTEVDYKDKIDITKICPNEKVIIVDFSFKPEIMNEVLKITKNVIWIDHHKTAASYKYDQELKGLRDFTDKGDAGCELTWKYFNETKEMPDAVKLIGDRDAWKWQYADTAEFNQGLKLYPHQPNDCIWDELLGNNHGLVNLIVEKGKTCIDFRNSFCRDYLKSFGFETNFEGYKCLAMGLYMFGSEAFGSRFKDYDICISFEYDGEKYTVGLYSEKVDVGEIAKKYGGGGHKGASGFIIRELPFKKIEV